MAAGGTAVAVALAVYPAVSSAHMPLALIGGLGVILAVVGALTGAVLPLGAGLGALVVEYAVAAGLEGSGLDTRADVWGAGLLLAAELLFLAAELRTSVLEGGDLVARRLGTIALLVRGLDRARRGAALRGRAAPGRRAPAPARRGRRRRRRPRPGAEPGPPMSQGLSRRGCPQ